MQTMSSYASNNYKRCSATPQTSVRVIGLRYLHTAEHMHTAEARAMRRWESALHAAQSMTYIRPRPTRIVSYPSFRRSPFPHSSGTAQRRTVDGDGASEHVLRAWTTFPFHLLVATFPHIPPSSSQAGAVPAAARRRGAAARAWAPKMP